MNKVIQINLGGIALTIDNDAHQRLSDYMAQLEFHFKHSESRDEIISDIESRLAEILNDRLKDREIVSIEDVEGAIKIMGTPDEFEDEPMSDQTSSRGTWDIKTGKRLFRDPDDKVIGGVCAGLAAYFGIQDPIWVRIGFAVVFFTMGVGLLLYLIMWALIPEARTASDRLAMMGEPANAKNIADMVERGLDDLSETIRDNWKQFKFKKKSRRSERADHMRDTRQNWIHVMMFPVHMFRYLIRAIVRLCKRVFRRSAHYYDRNPYV